MTVGELEHGRGTPMSSSELVEWKAFWKIKNDEWKQEHGDSSVPK